MSRKGQSPSTVDTGCWTVQDTVQFLTEPKFYNIFYKRQAD